MGFGERVLQQHCPSGVSDGGFNEHLLNEGDEATIKQEVARCLDAAMDGGGYVLRSTGQIFFTKPGLIEVMCETARELGVYR